MYPQPFPGREECVARIDRLLNALLGGRMPTLVRGGVVLPMSGPRQVLDPGSVLIDGTGIVAVGDVATLDADPRAAGGRGGRRHRARGHPRPAQLPPALGAAAGHGRVDVAVGLAADLRRPGPQGADARDRPGGVAALLRRGPAGRAPRRSWTCGGSWRARPAVAAELGIRATLVPYVADAEGYDYFETIASNRRAARGGGRRPHRHRRTGARRGSASSTSSTARPSASPRRWRWPTSSTPASTPTRPRRSGRSASR